MQPPDSLSGPGRAAWRSAVRSLEALGEDASQSSGMLRVYGEAVDVAYVIRRSWIASGRPALSEGSRGQDVEHPLVAAIRDQERHVERLSETLLLTPKSRASAQRGGWKRGHARSQDRDARPALRLAKERP